MVNNNSMPPVKSHETGFLDDLRIKQTLSDKTSKSNSDFDSHNAQCETNPSSCFSVNTQNETHSFENSPEDEKDLGACGSLPKEARGALVFLLRHGVVLFSQKPGVFETICRYETAMRRHLSDVFLRLVLDEKTGVAFVASNRNEHVHQKNDTNDAGDEDQETVSLISRRTLPLYYTLLLLVLRKHYRDREVSGEQKIVIDTERIESYLTPFLPLSNSTKTDRRKLNAALKKMVEKKVLSTVRGSKDRFEITPVIRYVVSAEFLETMLSEYTRIAREN